MAINWRAVILGFLTILAIGAVGLAIPGIGQLVAGFVGGAVAGYLSPGGWRAGVVHGLLAGSVGGLLVGVLLWAGLSLAGLSLGPVSGVFGTLAGAGAFVIAAVIAVVTAIDSAVGGLLAGWLQR